MRRGTRTSQRGMTLIETLIAFLILFFVMVSVLQIFSMAYMVNMGSAARTDMTYRAERVAEVIRTIYAFESRQPATFAAMQTASGVNLQTQVNTTVTLPPTGKEAFWGSGWANAVDANGPYTMSYEVMAGAAGTGARWTLTVVARPKTSGRQYVGPMGPGKAVRYAASIM